MLTSAHSALDDRIFHREAKTLHEAGFSVCVVGQHPRSEVIQGIQIHALLHPANRMRRLMLGITLLKVALRLNARLYIFHDPELIAIGLVLESMGKKVIYDAHENLPFQIRQKDWIWYPFRWALIPLAVFLEYLAGRFLDGVIAAVPAIQKRFPPSHTELVRNFPTETALSVLSEGDSLSQRRNLVIYTGSLSRVRGITELVEAFRGLEDDELWLVGAFDDFDYEAQTIRSLPKNVIWMGWKSHPEVLKLYRFAKAGTLLLYPTPNHRCALPVKLFEYLAAGLPVISSNIKEYTELVAGCGLQVDPHDVPGIRNAIRKLLENDVCLNEMSVRARARVWSIYRWQPEGDRLISFCRRSMKHGSLS